ncbi:hypothetical protein V6N13_129324 [Hibiscus sabdariffa]|uniref:Uncharacterized protein n=1 Tax=Hibiscus sabdariffa TaxID=183260 RepID=A0ABR2SKU3_9ROSI
MNVGMAKRNEIPRNGTAHLFNEPAIANQVPIARAPNLSTHACSMPSLMSRCNVVPVVLRPAGLSNGESVTNQPFQVARRPAHLVTSKGTSNGK